MFSSYTEFEIEFQPRNGEVYPISARGPAGDQTGVLPHGDQELPATNLRGNRPAVDLADVRQCDPFYDALDLGLPPRHAPHRNPPPW